MQNNKINEAENNLYNSKIKNIDKNLKNLIRTQKKVLSSHTIDDELER